MTTLAKVNKTLKAMGKAERLMQTNDYFYFEGGDAATWKSCGIYTYSIKAWSTKMVIAEYNLLASQK